MSSAHDHIGEASLDSIVADVADEYLERMQRGENPRIEDYASRYPQIADVLRHVLPAVGLMRQSSFGESEAADVPEVEGTLGDYHLLREIGRGGMGVVYEAEQISLQRRVALKVLPFAAALDAKRLERFKNEAMAAGQLHHTNIVPVHAVGCERGVWYYAMQMIDGESLAEVLEQLRRLVGQGPARHSIDELPADLSELARNPSGVSVGDPVSLSAMSTTASGRPLSDQEPQEVTPPSVRESAIDTAHAALSTAQGTQAGTFIRTVAQLAIQAAEALEHAHSLDVVHRDIKPGNLLIDQRGNLWVTDFGLARFRDDATLTVTGDLVGTLGYMSPEQASGRRGVVDHLTDIYSLGATLYELLTLQPAFAETNRAALLRRISSDEPIQPRKLNPGIPVDLETIILKAMAREPQHRYATAQAMADDLRCFLDNRPILARRPNLIERAAKWARRHRAIVSSAVIILLLLVVGLGISTALITAEQKKTRNALVQLAGRQQETQNALRAEAQQRRVTQAALAAEEEQRQLAETNLQLAERNFQQAREVLDLFLEVVEEDLAPHEELSDVRAKLLLSGLEYYQDFIEQARDNPPLRGELAASHVHVARILNEIGSTPAAMAALEQALQTQERLVRDHPTDAALRRGLFGMYFELGVFDANGPIMFVGHPHVQSHLGMSREQMQAANALAGAFHAMHREWRGSDDPTKMRQRFQQETKRALAEIDDVLDADQVKRLWQIALQFRGTSAYGDPLVADALGLSPGQRAEIREINQEIREIFRGGRRKDRGEIRRQIQDSKERIDAVLTDEQKTKWREMIGEPFTAYRWKPHHHRRRGSGMRRSRSGERRGEDKLESHPSKGEEK